MQTPEPILLGICSDTHDGPLPQWSQKGIAAVLHGGDVYDAPSLIDEETAALREWVQAQGVPVLAVRGNHDFRDPGQFFKAAEDITGKLRKIQPGLWVAGIGFAPRQYFDLPGETELEGQCREVSRWARRVVLPGESLILLTHYPPKLPEVCASNPPPHWTYRCIAELVDELQPLAVVQGHVHEWFGQQWRHNQTLIASPGPAGAAMTISWRDGIAQVSVS